MNVFIAGSSRILPRCIRVRDSLRRLGFIVPCDWMGRMQERRDAGLSDAELTVSERSEARAYDLAGVDACDALLWLSECSEGAAYEAGYATKAGKLVIVSGEFPHELYGKSEAHVFVKDSDAIEWLVQWARKGGYDAKNQRHDRG